MTVADVDDRLFWPSAATRSERSAPHANRLQMMCSELAAALSDLLDETLSMAGGLLTTLPSYCRSRTAPMHSDCHERRPFL